MSMNRTLFFYVVLITIFSYYSPTDTADKLPEQDHMIIKDNSGWTRLALQLSKNDEPYHQLAALRVKLEDAQQPPALSADNVLLLQRIELEYFLLNLDIQENNHLRHDLLNGSDISLASFNSDTDRETFCKELSPEKITTTIHIINENKKKSNERGICTKRAVS